MPPMENGGVSLEVRLTLLCMCLFLETIIGLGIYCSNLCYINLGSMANVDS